LGGVAAGWQTSAVPGPIERRMAGDSVAEGSVRRLSRGQMVVQDCPPAAQSKSENLSARDVLAKRRVCGDCRKILSHHPLQSSIKLTSHKPTYGDQPVCAYAMVGPTLKFRLTSPVPIIGQDTSQIQRQHLLEFSHNQDFPFGICFPIERHHASDYLERYVCSE
jgi:hypothetical protein